MRSMRLLPVLLLPILLGPSPSALAAQVAAVFGGRIPCVLTGGVQFCQGGLGTRIESFDGVPLDVDVTLPPPDQTGPFPVIFDLHGWGLSKTDTPFVARAQAGYVVVSYTARGFGQSCGAPASRAPDPTLTDRDVCVKRGWIRLADARYEAHDTQHLAGLLADEGLVIPDRVGVTGASYGGGQSMTLGALHDRVMMPDGTLVQWTSPGGLPMSIAAAAPLIPWSDLAQALTPNGRTIDYRVENPYGSRAGVEKQSWEDTLFNLGASSYYAPPGADPDADLAGWHARIGQGEPYDGDPLLQHALDELTQHHSAYYIDDSVTPAPLFIYNSWTDDLFPGDEALRFYLKARAHHPDAEIALQLADGFGHPRSSLTALASLTRVNQRVDDFFARHLKGANVPPPPTIETYTQACNGAQEEGPFLAPAWQYIHFGEVRFTDRTAHAFTSAGGDPDTAKALDPLAAGILSSPCRTVPIPATDDPGAATYRLPEVVGGVYTLMGAPTIIAHLDVSGSFAQIVGRLWDVSPNGTQTLVSQAIYRPHTDNPTTEVFQLHPNGWRFALAHVPKLGLVGQSPPYGRAATGRFRITVTDLELRLPVAEPPAPNGANVFAPAPPVIPSTAPEPPDGPPSCGAAPASDCSIARAGRLTWRKRSLDWSWTGDADRLALGEPLRTAAYRLCVWDDASRLVASAAIPAGACPDKRRGPCWRPKGKGARQYLDPRGTMDGVRAVHFGGGRRLSLTLRATLDATPVRRVRAQLLSGPGGCWETARKH
jgi:predicted acyl esterase